METIFVLLPVALVIAAIAVGCFVWAARSGQFDDLDTPAVRMLFEDDPPSPVGRRRDTSAIDDGRRRLEASVGTQDESGATTRRTTGE